MAMPGEKNISAFINSEVSEKFKKQCEARGFTKYRAVEGALRLWLTLTPTEQVGLIEGKVKPVSDDDLDKQIRQFARDFSILAEKLERRGTASGKGKSRRKSG
jgi:hypothetical protein